MSITIDEVQAADLINTGRVKWNNNDKVLKDGVNSLDSQQAAHVGEGHPLLYYNKSEIDGKISTEQSARQNADSDLQTDINDLETALGTHKTSGDHDTRYYQKSEVDGKISNEQSARQNADSGLQTDIEDMALALNQHKESNDHDAHNDGRYISLSIITTFVRTTLAQTIEGIKTFKESLRVKKSGGGLLVSKDDGTATGSLYFNTDTVNLATCDQYGETKTVLNSDANNIYMPNHELYVKGRKISGKNTLQYKALMTQRGSSNPEIVRLIRNDFQSNTTWIRIAEGLYRLSMNAPGEFYLDKTIVIITQWGSAPAQGFTVQNSSQNSIDIYTAENWDAFVVVETELD